MIERSNAGPSPPLLVMMLVALLTGCGNAGYYAQAIGGHLGVMRAATPIDALVRQPDSEPEEKKKLQDVQAIRDFASSALALPDNASYRSYADLGREVFAMPGSIHSPTAKGCHQLIKQGARLVESVADVLSELGLATHAEPLRGAPSDVTVLPEDPLLAALGWDPVDPETLLQRLQSGASGGWPPSLKGPPSQGRIPPGGPGGAQSLPVEAVGMLERLVWLELSGRVERLADGRFKRLFK